MMTAEQAVFAAILTCGVGAGLALLAARWHRVAGWLAFLATAASAGLVITAGAESLRAPGPGTGFSWLAAGVAWHHLQVDGLSSIFLLLAAAIALPVSLYSIHFLRQHPVNSRRYYPYFLLFMAAIYGLLSTSDTLWSFLLFWQLMVFCGYELIRFDRSTSRAGANRFAIMLELACAALVAGSGLLAHGAGAGTPATYQWHVLTANLPRLLSVAPWDGTLAFALLLLGFAIVVGVWPFGQTWLPQASSSAPAPVSALLCGALLNLGAYGLIRYFLFLAPASPQFHTGAWGGAMTLLGTITLFAGTMQALQQEQSRRLLAFHSIGQMGYILLALGTCLALLRAPAASAIAGFALLAALFHIVNHGLFSTLLHLNSGSVENATGTQDLNRLGGLMKYMPLTGLTALAGVLAISGVPLTNGFASKWAIVVAAVQGASTARYLAICAMIAILTSGLTLASSIKFFGTSFLSRTSELVAEKAGPRPAPGGAEPRAHRGSGNLEVGWSMQAPQVLLALVCVLLGILPGLAFGLLQQAIAKQGGALLAGAAAIPAGTWSGVAAPQSAAVFVPLALLGALAVSFALAYGISRLGSASRRAAAPWLCGYAAEAESHRYMARNFFGEIKRHFHWLDGAHDGRIVTVKRRAS